MLVLCNWTTGFRKSMKCPQKNGTPSTENACPLRLPWRFAVLYFTSSAASNLDQPSGQTQKPSPTWLVKVSPSVCAALTVPKSLHRLSSKTWGPENINWKTRKDATILGATKKTPSNFAFSISIGYWIMYHFTTLPSTSPWISRNLLGSKISRQLQYSLRPGPSMYGDALFHKWPELNSKTSASPCWQLNVSWRPLILAGA